MERVIKGTAEAYRAEAELEYLRIVPPTVNDEAVVSIAQKSAVAVLGENCLASNPATTGGEDFSYFMQRVPGAIALLGTGNEACGAVWPNHSGNFCVDEASAFEGAPCSMRRWQWISTHSNWSDSYWVGECKTMKGGSSAAEICAE